MMASIPNSACLDTNYLFNSFPYVSDDFKIKCIRMNNRIKIYILWIRNVH